MIPTLDDVGANKKKTMEKQRPSNNIDIVITGNVAWNDSLSWDVKILYGVVRGLTRNDFYCCYAGNDYLAEQMNKSARTIRTFLNELEAEGYIVRDYAYIECNDGKIRRKRAVVPKDLYDKFLIIREEMQDAKERASKKICSKGGENLPPVGGEKFPPTILKEYPCENIISSNTEVRTNPQTPLQGGEQAVTLVENEQFEAFGKFGNVRLTKAQKAGLLGEFGSELTSALIEQLDSYIQSDKRRQARFSKRGSDRLYATLRDWALRRREPEPSKKVLIGGRDMERREYSNEEINSLFTLLDGENDDTT